MSNWGVWKVGVYCGSILSSERREMAPDVKKEQVWQRQGDRGRICHRPKQRVAPKQSLLTTRFRGRPFFPLSDMHLSHEHKRGSKKGRKNGELFKDAAVERVDAKSSEQHSCRRKPRVVSLEDPKRWSATVGVWCSHWGWPAPAEAARPMIR